MHTPAPMIIFSLASSFSDYTVQAMLTHMVLLKLLPVAGGRKGEE